MTDNVDGSKGDAREYQHTDEYGSRTEPTAVGRGGKSFPLGIDGLVVDILLGIEGTLSLCHQGVELTALLIREYFLPLLVGISLGLFHHLEQ
jgi:hypothetical protein